MYMIEYRYFWYFYQDGNIQFEVKLTGVLSLGAAKHGESPKYGTMIASNLYAPNHQHFFNVRLDFFLDGVCNSVERVDIVAEDDIDDEEKFPFHNAFYAKATLLESEKASCAHIDTNTMRSWKISNPSVLNGTGKPVAYKFIPGDNSIPLASKKAWWRKRAG